MPDGREVVLIDTGTTGMADASFEDAELPATFRASTVK
jgi:hypothetical protein